MDDEQVGPDAVGGCERGAHAEEPAIGLTPLCQRFVDGSQVLIDPID